VLLRLWLLPVREEGGRTRDRFLRCVLGLKFSRLFFGAAGMLSTRSATGRLPVPAMPLPPATLLAVAGPGQAGALLAPRAVLPSQLRPLAWRAYMLLIELLSVSRNPGGKRCWPSPKGGL